MNEREVPHIEVNEPFEWSERDLAMLKRVYRRQLLASAVSAAVTSAVLTTVMFFGFMWWSGSG